MVPEVLLNLSQKLRKGRASSKKLISKISSCLKLNNRKRYVGGSFDVESLVENLLGQLAGHQEILVNVYDMIDMTNSTEPLIMYGNQYEEGDVSLVHESELDFGDPYKKHQMICRYHPKAPTNWTSLTTAFLFFVILLLVGYILYGAGNHIVKVEDDFHEMQELKVQVEASDVAKSQVHSYIKSA